mmetsp:Transcript_22866/g.38224  ORF Transcript_22866/g.38224 Transcript_22866/m.38224 type:complete len:223 (+) Transcript_22866:4681-5349(+)
MRLLHAGDSLRCRQQAQEPDVRGTALLEQVNRRNRRVSGGQHRINGNDHAVLHRLGNLEIILNRLQRLFIPVKANKTHTRRRNQFQHTVQQPVPGPQNRNQRQLLARKRRRIHLGHGCVDPLGGHVQFARHLIGQELADLAQELPKHRRWGVAVTHDGQLVLHQRVINDREVVGHGQHSARQNRTPCAASKRRKQLSCFFWPKYPRGSLRGQTAPSSRADAR